MDDAIGPGAVTVDCFRALPVTLLTNQMVTQTAGGLNRPYWGQWVWTGCGWAVGGSEILCTASVV